MSADYHRKCCKCGATPLKDHSVTMHRFPKAGKTNILRLRAWAKYCWPEQEWLSVDELATLNKSHKVLCGKHFDSSCFSDSGEQKLSRFAVPGEKESVKNSLITLRNEMHLMQGSSSLETFESTDSPADLLSTSEPLQQCTSSLETFKCTDLPADLPSTSEPSQQMKFTARGLMPPVFTPLNDDLTVNYQIIPAYAKYLVDAGIKSVLVGGTTGEHMSLNVEDRKKVVDAWLKSGKTIGLHIQVQVGGAPMADVLNLAKYCSKAGVDSLLTLPELYFKPQTVDELVSYVELVANAAPNLPVLYYHIPSMSKVEINMPAFVTAATEKIPNFKGIKFTSNDLSEGAQVLRALKDDQEIFLGADTLLAPASLLGIKSSIGTTFNLFPLLAQDILDAMEKKEIEKATMLQEKLSKAIEAHTAEGAWVPIMKAGMEIISGIKVGPPSLPQKPISIEAKKRIESKLRTLGVIRDY